MLCYITMVEYLIATSHFLRFKHLWNYDAKDMTTSEAPAKTKISYKATWFCHWRKLEEINTSQFYKRWYAAEADALLYDNKYIDKPPPPQQITTNTSDQPPPTAIEPQIQAKRQMRSTTTRNLTKTKLRIIQAQVDTWMTRRTLTVPPIEPLQTTNRSDMNQPLALQITDMLHDDTQYICLVPRNRTKWLQRRVVNSRTSHRRMSMQSPKTNVELIVVQRINTVHHCSNIISTPTTKHSASDNSHIQLHWTEIDRNLVSVLWITQ